MTKLKKTITVVVDERELATILAALRFHQDENLQGCSDIPDLVIREIATNCGSLKSLNFEEVGKLCERINTCQEAHNTSPPLGLTIAPPPKEKGKYPLFRVVYVIDVNASDTGKAALAAHRIMKDPESWAPVLDVMDCQGEVTRMDLSDLDSDRGKEGDHV
jgi:hypothetical protein